MGYEIELWFSCESESDAVGVTGGEMAVLGGKVELRLTI
jgi:hypothetical protein